MEETNGFRQGSMLAPGNSWQPSDIGGPMRLDSEYRWNVPIVTYGFDRSFLDYFGANGVLGLAVLVFLILLITDILGFTKVFPFTRPAK